MKTKGSFITIKPQDELVSRYIDCYYFHSSDDPGFNGKFTFYPNYKHGLTIYKNSDVSFSNTSSLVTPSEAENYIALYSVNTNQSFNVSLTGCFNKIGIVFNPIGINHFISKPLSDVFTPAFAALTYFEPNLQIAAEAAFTEPDVNVKARFLDAFFKSAYCGFNEPVIKKAVQEILNSNGSVRVEELSAYTGVNRKTLLRLFKKHLCVSVEEYKKMVMFRNALNYSQHKREDASLTNVALYSLYYDQAHFIKHFKAVTQQSPKELLSKLTQIGSQDIYWRFED